MAKTMIFKSFREYGEYCKKQPWYGLAKPVKHQVRCEMSKHQIDQEMRNNRNVGYHYKQKI